MMTSAKPLAMPLRFAAAVALALMACPAHAQDAAATGTGGGPASTLRAPNTTAVGQTKPPGSAGAPAEEGERNRLDRLERKGDSIQSGICIGCDK